VSTRKNAAKIAPALRSAAKSVGDAVGKATAKIRKAVADAKTTRAAKSKPAPPAKRSAAPKQAASRPAPAVRTRKPLGGVADAALQGDDYEPQQASAHAPFRSTGGDDRSIDEQLPAEMTTNDQFSDEDHFTNHSGDPRIGTHNRSYEPPAGSDEDDDTPEI
jgi:hypothetical protein